MTDFASILNTKADSAKKPEALPAGSYITRVRDFKTREAKSKTGEILHFIDVNHNIVEPHDGVDLDELAERQVNLQKRILRGSFLLTDDTVWRLSEFFEKCGLTIEGRSFADLLQEVKGCEVISIVTERPAGDVVYNDIAGYRSLDSA